MGDKLDMDQLRKKEFAKRTRWLVLAESLVILGLLVWISIEYQNNIYLQGWANANIGPASFLLNGALAGLYAGTLLGYFMSKYLGKSTEEEEILETLKKKSLK
jgi:F0F1-type ATP synthase membrane subunit c/vacuolar-type H+-ATPase subunit K